MAEPFARRGFLEVSGVTAAGLALTELPTVRQTSDARADFIHSVQKARLFDLSYLWDEAAPIVGVNPPSSMELNATHASTRGEFDDNNQLSYSSEIQQWSGQHGAPSLDGLAHIGFNGELFGGVDAAAATSDRRGVGRSGVGEHLDVAHYPKDLLVNRGVLLDVARFIQGDSSPLPEDFNINNAHLADTARSHGVKIRRGDTILIRTGWGQFFTSDPARYAGEVAAGVGVAGAKWLVEQQPVVVGSDSVTFEVRPPVSSPPETPTEQVFPVHLLLIPGNGINIIENYFLEEISEAREYEFLLVVPPLKIRGGTGSALRSFALVP